MMNFNIFCVSNLHLFRALSALAWFSLCSLLGANVDVVRVLLMVVGGGFLALFFSGAVMDILFKSIAKSRKKTF